MNRNTLEKIIAIALHPTTVEEEAMNAFRKLYRNASKFGGLRAMLSDGEGVAELNERVKRAEQDARTARTEYSNIFSEYNEAISKCNAQRAEISELCNHAKQAGAEAIKKQKRIEMLEAEIADLKENGGNDELGIIARQHAQIADLAAKFKSVNQALAESDASRERYAAEQVAAASNDIKQRVMSAFADEAPMREGVADTQQEEAPAKPKRASAKKAKSAASAKARPRPQRATRRGEDAERIVDDALTFDWKSVRTLFREAQNRGFKGTENAIRFAAERLVAVGNAIAGYNNEGRIAYRRA